MLVWWVVLIVGVIVFAAGAFGTTLAYRGERVPRLGIWPDFRTRLRARWTWAPILFGTAMMVFGSMRLAGSPEDPWPAYKYLFPAVALSWLVQTLIVAQHNRRITQVSAGR